MAQVVPFRAVRPASDKAGRVSSRSYEDYSPEELALELEANPMSFLNIIHQSTFHRDKPIAERFAFIQKKYEEFKAGNILIQDENPCFYLYELTQRNHVFCGFIAGTSAEDYENNRIKRHEETISFRENLFKNYLEVVGFNADPVLLTYPDQEELSVLTTEIKTAQPDCHFTTPNGDHHKLWIVKGSKIETIIRHFEKVETLYIADGHHRSASSFLLAQDRKSSNPNHRGDETYNFFMSLLIPESQLKIYEYNRVFKDLNGLSKEEFLDHLSVNFDVQPQAGGIYKASKPHEFSMYLDGVFYRLSLMERLQMFKNPLESLDAQILFEKILRPILGITDLRNDRRIRYIHGSESLSMMKKLIDAGDFRVGFGLFPVHIHQLKAIADAHLSMPPKSTYIEPKLRSALTIYEF
jgi:uncharacterized protein (DUF1015 family)